MFVPPVRSMRIASAWPRLGSLFVAKKFNVTNENVPAAGDAVLVCTSGVPPANSEMTKGEIGSVSDRPTCMLNMYHPARARS